MTDEFDQQMRKALDDRAEGAPRVDLARGAVQQAGRIRRRRRVLSGVAVLAVAAFVIPVGTYVLDDDSIDHTTSRPNDDTSPSKPVDVEMAGLSQGGPPSVPYLSASDFHPVDGPAISLATRGHITDAVLLRDVVVVWKIDTSTGKTTYAADDEVTLSLPQGESVSSPAVNLAEERAAWSVQRGKAPAGYKQAGDTLALADTETGELNTTMIDEDTVSQVMGVHDRAIIFNGRDGKDPYVGLLDFDTDINNPSTPWPDATNVTAVDPNFERMAGQTRVAKGADRACSVMFNIVSSDEEWKTCDWLPVEFSADGSLVLAIRPGSDGLGPRELGVLKADDGALVQSFTTEGTFGRATFEGEEFIDVVLNVADQAAIVRCPIDASDCQLATPEEKVVPDDPASLISPYQLTAN